LTPLKRDWLREIVGRLAAGIENDVEDDKAIAFALYDRRIRPSKSTVLIDLPDLTPHAASKHAGNPVGGHPRAHLI
jgi:hypothetical protein